MVAPEVVPRATRDTAQLDQVGSKLRRVWRDVGAPVSSADCSPPATISDSCNRQAATFPLLENEFAPSRIRRARSWLWLARSVSPARSPHEFALPRAVI